MFIYFPWAVIDSAFALFGLFNSLLSLCRSCFHFSPAICIFLFSSKAYEYSVWAPRTHDSNCLWMSTFKTPLLLWIPSMCCATSFFMLWSKICSFVENPDSTWERIRHNLTAYQRCVRLCINLPKTTSILTLCMLNVANSITIAWLLLRFSLISCNRRNTTRFM